MPPPRAGEGPRAGGRRSRDRSGSMPGVTTAGDHHGHTHRLDLTDASVREWDATVVAADPEQGVVLDRSAFYPGGGGQPPDEGVLLWGGVHTRIAGTRKGDELYLIPVEGDPLPPQSHHQHSLAQTAMAWRLIVATV